VATALDAFKHMTDTGVEAMHLGWAEVEDAHYLIPHVEGHHYYMESPCVDGDAARCASAIRSAVVNNSEICTSNEHIDDTPMPTACKASW
jgi:hypothetical protein